MPDAGSTRDLADIMAERRALVDAALERRLPPAGGTRAPRNWSATTPSHP